MKKYATISFNLSHKFTDHKEVNFCQKVRLCLGFCPDPVFKKYLEDKREKQKVELDIGHIYESIQELKILNSMEKLQRQHDNTELQF